jgi:hypothetical protein
VVSGMSAETKRLRLKLIGCEVLSRELAAGVAASPHTFDVEFVEIGLHERGQEPMRAALQERIDRAGGRSYDAIVLGYGLCGNGLHGIAAREIPLVIPRVDDCIALLLGGRDAYKAQVEANPGTFFYSTGWLERAKFLDQLSFGDQRIDLSLDTLVSRYGSDNGSFLFQELTSFKKRYGRIAFIKTGLEPSPHFEAEAQAQAEDRGWSFGTITGNLALLHSLFAGRWEDSQILAVPPGHTVVGYSTAGVLSAELPQSEALPPLDGARPPKG